MRLSFRHECLNETPRRCGDQPIGQATRYASAKIRAAWSVAVAYYSYVRFARKICLMSVIVQSFDAAGRVEYDVILDAVSPADFRPPAP